MNRDTELYLQWKMDYPHLTQAEAARMLAANTGLSEDSLRSRLNRAGKTIKAKTALYDAQREQVPLIPRAVQKQKEIINNSTAIFDDWQTYDEDRIGIFVSDAHIPNMRIDAFELALTISDDVRPHAITALNDSLDNKGFGMHPDSEAVYKQVWRQSVDNAFNMQAEYHEGFRSTLRSGGFMLGLMGNHDKWIFKHWRSNTPQSAEKNIAEYMNDLFEHNQILMFSRGDENVIHLSSGLAWVHGLTVASLPTTVARKGFVYFMEDGRAKSWVQGHTHRPAYLYGDGIGYNGVVFANSGHLRNDDPDWLTHKAKNWGMAVVICKYNPTKWEHDVTLVRFVERGAYLVAKYEGKTYDVPLNKSRPSYML